VSAWLDELDGFGGESMEHDDQVDSLSGAHTQLTRGGKLRSAVPRGSVPRTVVRGDSAPRDGAGRPDTLPDTPTAAGAVQGRPSAINRRRMRVELTPGSAGGL
jgi:hypothetical protein